MNQATQNDWPKETWKKHPIKVIQATMRAQLSNSGTLLLRLPVCLSTRTILFFLQINTLHALLLSVFVEILFCKAKEPGAFSDGDCSHVIVAMVIEEIKICLLLGRKVMTNLDSILES